MNSRGPTIQIVNADNFLRSMGSHVNTSLCELAFSLLRQVLRTRRSLIHDGSSWPRERVASGVPAQSTSRVQNVWQPIRVVERMPVMFGMASGPDRGIKNTTRVRRSGKSPHKREPHTAMLKWMGQHVPNHIEPIAVGHSYLNRHVQQPSMRKRRT